MTIGNCGCGRAWKSLTEAHCRICHAHFTTVSAFDKHQPTRGGCPDPAALRDGRGNPVLELADRGGGPVWGHWASAESRAAFRERRAKLREADARSGGRL